MNDNEAAAHLASSSWESMQASADAYTTQLRKFNTALEELLSAEFAALFCPNVDTEMQRDIARGIADREEARLYRDREAA